MKSVLSDKCCKKEEKPFPKLMRSPATDGIFLMVAVQTGVCVHKASSGCSLGVSTAYINHDESFEDYEGDVCLTND